MQKANADIRQAAQSAGVKLWQIAEALNKHDFNFSRMLRRELSAEEKTNIHELINQIAGECKRND